MKQPIVAVLKESEVTSSARESLRSFSTLIEWKPGDGESRDAAALFVGLSHPVDRELLDHFPSLSLLVSPTTGLQHIDVDECAERNITVLSLGDVKEQIQHITSTGEHTLGLMFALVRHTIPAHLSVIDGNRWNRMEFVGRQVADLTVGIIGLGRIGTHVARVCRVLGARVLWSDPAVTAVEGDCGEKTDLQTLLSQSDVVSLHVSASVPEPVIDEASLKLIKRGALLVNTSRGHLMDEEAVAHALVDGRVCGVAVDVLHGEWRSDWEPSKSPLVTLAREGYPVVITPHLGGCTIDAMDHTGLVMVEALRAWFHQGGSRG